MTQVTVDSTATSPTPALERQVRERIDSLSYLPTTAAVAMKFVELGRNLEADPADYAKVISADSSLSSKMLALANSSWAGVRHKVTNVRIAVNLLGLGTVRTLAISYCMTGLHNELHLTPEESAMFWESSLYKAAAAKEFASLCDAKLADEAFVAGFVQDFALTVMYATAKEQLLDILQSPGVGVQAQLEKERELFGMDHAEVGRILAQKLELPDLFVDAIAFHHNHEKLIELLEPKLIGDATHVASLLPHVLRAWHREDADALVTFLQGHALSIEPSAFVQEVQKEFNEVYNFFHEGSVSQTQLAELLGRAAREVADTTTQLVGTVNDLMRQAAAMGTEMNELLKQQDELADKATRDQLTGVLNREGFVLTAREMLGKAARYGIGFGIVYLDIDKFKLVNDMFGHELGDLALRSVVRDMTEAVSQHDLIGRMGGDEFVILLNDCAEQDARRVVERMVSAVAARPIRKQKQAAPITMSAGLLYVRPGSSRQELDPLVTAADKLMYRAKRPGGNRTEVRAIQP